MRCLRSLELVSVNCPVTRVNSRPNRASVAKRNHTRPTNEATYSRELLGVRIDFPHEVA